MRSWGGSLWGLLQQQQSVALWICHPDLPPKRFLSHWFQDAAPEAESQSLCGLELIHLQTEGKASRLRRLRPLPGWPINHQCPCSRQLQDFEFSFTARVDAAERAVEGRQLCRFVGSQHPAGCLHQFAFTADSLHECCCTLDDSAL